MNTYVIDLHDRAGSLERLLNLCRRKGYGIHTLQFGPGNDPGVRRIVVAFEDGCPPAERVLPNLTRIIDVVAVQAADAGAHAIAADVAVASLHTRTRAA